MKKLFIIGAGGHGKVVVDAAIAAGYKVAGFIDDIGEKTAKGIYNIGIIGPVCDAIKIIGKNDLFVVAIGNNNTRKKIFNKLNGNAKAAIVIHPSAIVSQTVKVGAGSVILPNAVINSGAGIGNNCIINSLSLVDHETVIGSHSHIAQGSIIGSMCVLPEMITTELGQKIKSGTKL